MNKKEEGNKKEETPKKKDQERWWGEEDFTYTSLLFRTPLVLFLQVLTPLFALVSLSPSYGPS